MSHENIYPLAAATDEILFAERTKGILRTFGPAEWLLYLFCKKPREVFKPRRYAEPTEQWTAVNALDELISAFPNLRSLISRKRVLDYGCGDGFQAVALAKERAEYILGVDILEPRLRHGERMAQGLTNISFSTAIEGIFDVAISLNSFEHFPKPEQNLRELAASVVPGGMILITFGSPWLSPYGSHMNFFTILPWVNILFSEKTVFRVRRLYRDDSYECYEPGINKMTIARFERIVAQSSLKLVTLKFGAVKNILFLTKIPFARELFINRVTCILECPRSSTQATVHEASHVL